MGLSVQSNGGSLQLSTLSTIQTLAASILPTQGNVFFVNPRTGNDVGGQGTRDNPYKSIAAAFSKCVAGQNDTIFLCASGNAAADTTDYQTTSLLWNKDLVHLIGVNDGPIFSQRSRVAFASTYATAAALINVSASGCAFRNIEFFMGVASALPLGCMSFLASATSSRTAISRDSATRQTTLPGPIRSRWQPRLRTCFRTARLAWTQSPSGRRRTPRSCAALRRPVTGSETAG